MTPIRNNRGCFRSLHANVLGRLVPTASPHMEEGRNEAVGRPNQRSTPRRNPRSQPGAHRREERGRPSKPGLFTFVRALVDRSKKNVPTEVGHPSRPSAEVAYITTSYMGGEPERTCLYNIYTLRFSAEEQR